MNIYKSILIVLASLLLTTDVFAQAESPEHIFTITDKAALPVIGETQLANLISSFVKEHAEYGGNGSESIWFVVKSNGDIGEIRPPLRLGGNIDIYKYNAEVALVKSLKYIPAKVHEKSVASWQSISIPYFRKEISTDKMISVGALEVKGNSKTPSELHKASVSSADLEKKVFEVVEHMPLFPGGLYYLMSYLSENVKYPADAQKQGVQGRVVVSFVVEKDGSLSNVQIVHSVNPSLDAEALRVVKAMPNWIPGKQDGKAVRVKYNVPISFRLQ